MHVLEPNELLVQPEVLISMVKKKLYNWFTHKLSENLIQVGKHYANLYQGIEPFIVLLHKCKSYLSAPQKLSVRVEAEIRRMFQIAHQNTLALRKKTSLKPFSSAGLTVERSS